jgi:hypothetical protein
LKNQFSRNAGIEMGFTSLNGQWTGWTSHHRSFKPDHNSKNWWGNLGGQYKTRAFSWLTDLTHMGENYYADMGFEQRLENHDVARDTTLRIGYNFWFNNLGYQIFSNKKNGKLNFLLLGAELFNVFNPDGSLNESSNQVTAELNFKNTSEIKAKFGPTWANVPVSFKFDPEEDLEKCPALPAGAYKFTSGNVRWASDYRKSYFLAFALGGGTFYNGKQWQAEIEFTYRFQPIMNVSLKAQYNRLDFPAPYCNVELFNIAPRVEVFFAKNLWWTTFLQYNTQADNFNVNSRLQWRYRPMSDLFIVYTDNYAVNVFGVKNRAMTLKLNRWF